MMTKTPRTHSPIAALSLQFWRPINGIVALTVLLAVFVFPPAVWAQTPSITPQTPTVQPSGTPAGVGLIQMSVEAGFQGHFRPDTWTPLLVTVSNKGPDLTGQLVVNAGDSALGLTTAIFSVPINLPTHSSKRVFVYASFNGSVQQAQVDLVDSNGITQVSSVAPLSPLNSDDVMYIVVDDSPAGSLDLGVARPITAVAYQIRWSLDNFPPLADAWRGVNILLLTDTDSSRLTTDQRSALADWVNTGGHLIITGGPDWQKTLAGMADLSPLNVAGTVNLPAVSALATFADLPADGTLLTGTIIAAQGTLTGDGQVVVMQTITQNGSQSNVPLLVRRPVGSGLVDYLSVDPGLEPIRSWANRGALWQSLLSPATDNRNQPGWGRGIFNTAAASDAAASALGLRFPDVLQVGLFLLVYIILIGPVNYIVLRLLKRLEWAWLTIPILIVLATGAAYITGFDLRGTQPILNRLAVIQVWPNQTRARVDGVLGIISPRRSFYDATIGDGLNIRALPVGSSGLGLSGGSSAQVIESNTIGNTGNYHLSHVPIDAGLASTFVIGGTIPAPALDGSANISIALDGTATLQGEIRNRSTATISDSVIVAFNTTRTMGTLAPGQTRQFSYSLSPDAQLTRALAKDSNSGPNNYSYLYNNNGNQVTTLITLIDSASSLAGNTASNLSQRLNAERHTFLNGVVDPGELGGARGTNVYFVGWSDSLPFSTSLDNIGSSSEDMALYAVQLSRTVQPGQAISQPLTIPPGLQSWRSIPATLPVVGASALQQYGTPYSVYLNVGEKAAFEFAPLAGLRLSTVSQLLVTLHSYSGNRATISLWDWQRSQWVALDLAAISSGGQFILTDPADLARFVSRTNLVRVHMSATFGQVAFDRLDTTLSGTLAAADMPTVVGF